MSAIVRGGATEQRAERQGHERAVWPEPDAAVDDFLGVFVSGIFFYFCL